MFLKLYQNYFNRHVQICEKWCNLIPYEMNRKGRDLSIQVTTSRKTLIYANLHLLIHTLYTIIMAFKTVRTVVNPELNMGEKCLTFVFLMMWVCTAMWRMDWNGTPDIPVFVKTLVKFEEELTKCKVSKYTSIIWKSYHRVLSVTCDDNHIKHTTLIITVETNIRFEISDNSIHFALSY